MAQGDWTSESHFHDACTTLPLPALIDEIAARRPSRPFISLPINNDNLSQGYRDFTFGDLARAVDRCALWIVTKLGRCGNEDETRILAYVGPQDVRYPVLMLGAVKAGYTVRYLLLSVYNLIREVAFAFFYSIEESCRCVLGKGGHTDETIPSQKLQTFHPATPAEYCLSLLQHTGCKSLLFAEPMLPVVYAILSAQPMTVLAVPSASFFLPTSTGEPVPATPFAKTLAQVHNRPFSILHSSGTTGPPKPILLTHGAFVSHYSSFCKIASDSGGSEIAYSHFRGLRALIAAPISIAAGLYQLLGYNLVYEYTVALPPSWMVMTPEILDQIHMHGNVQVNIVPPKYFREIARNSSWLENLSRLRYMGYLGAPCPSHIGGTLAAKTRLTTLYGTTESGMYPNELTDPEDWEYISFNSLFPYEMRPVCQDLYEIVIVRRENGDAFQEIFKVYPDLAEWRVQDLFSKHPNKDNVWLYRGRTEDLIVSSSGETFLPKSMEGIIESHPFVDAALITDRGEAGLALLVQPQAAITCEELEQKFLDDIWPSVQRANEKCPVGQRIQKGLVTITRPMPRAAKGYPRRKMVYELYEKAMDELYRKEDVRLTALKDVHLPEEVKAELEADARIGENWDETFNGKGDTTVRIASQDIVV